MTETSVTRKHRGFPNVAQRHVRSANIIRRPIESFGDRFFDGVFLQADTQVARDHLAHVLRFDGSEDTKKIRDERRLFSIVRNADKLFKTDKQLGRSQMGLGIRRQQSLGNLAQIATFEISVMHRVIGRTGDFPDRLSERGPSHVERSGIVKRKWAAGEECGSSFQIVIRDASKICSQNIDLLQLGCRRCNRLCRFRKRSHDASSPHSYCCGFVKIKV